MGRRWILAAAATTVSGLVLAACGGDGGTGGGETDRPLRIMVTGGTSAEGVLADNSRTSILAARAGVEVLNEQGGVQGRDVEVEVVDDGGDPTVAVSKLREAIASDAKPDVYLNSGPSTIAAATLSILGQNDILSFNVGPTEDSQDPSVHPLNFDLSPAPRDYVEGFVPQIKEEGRQTVGILHGNSSYGVAFGASAEEVMSEAGLEVVGVEEYDVASLDMTPQLQSLRSGAPDVLMLDAYGAPVGYVLDGLAKLGWDVPLLGNTSVSSTTLLSTERPDGLLGTPQVEQLSMQVFRSTVQDPEAEDVNRAVEAMTEIGEIPSTLILAYNYDAPFLVAAAVEEIGGFEDKQALAEALETEEVQEAAETAILPRYHFTAESHAPNVGADVFTFIPPSPIENGQYAPSGG